MTMNGSARAYQHKRSIAALMCGSALATLFGSAAYAQAPAASAAPIEEVVVTGTSIRGVAPVGANLISIDRAAIEATGAQNVQQLLASTPQITGFNNGGVQGNQGGFVGSGENLPTIHSLGASSSQSTLILIDGHNITPSSADGYSDPNIIPNVAIQRVEVLPDGDSAVYGSSAVAGVINFVTRKDFEGLETSAQYGMAHQYQTFTFGQLAGHTWDTGSVWGAYEYDSNSRFMASSRSFSSTVDYRSRGGTNFDSFSCPTASISPSSATTANVYLYPYTSPPIGNASQSQQVANCDTTGSNSLIPSATKNAVFVRFRQDVGDRVHLGLDLNYASRVNDLSAPRGTIAAIAYGPTGSSTAEGTAARNPFYVGNAETGTASEFVRYDLTSLLGPQQSKNGVHDESANFTIGVDLFADWEMNINAYTGWDNSYSHTNAGFCSTCAELALNGTTNTTGGSGPSLADYFGLGTVNTSVRALTTSNALDVWDPAGPTNKTSQAVLNEIDGNQLNNDVNTNLADIRTRFDGTLFELPAGPIKASWGGEWYQYHVNIYNTQNPNDGPTISSAALNSALLSRSIYSAFAEFFIPVISPEMHIPLIQKFDLNAAGRVDWYKDTGGPQPGSTKNPRLGFTWVVDDAVKVRGNYGTSFTAPNLDFESSLIGTTASQAAAQAFTIPTAQINYPGSFCTTIAGACNVTTAMAGVTLSGGNPNLKPERGLTYSVGLDINPGNWFDIFKGWNNSVTYWQAKFQGGMTTPTLQQGLTVQGLEQVLILAPPGGWTPTSPGFLNAVEGFTQTSAFPSQIFYVTNFTRINAFTIQANGLDYTSNYNFSTADYGDFMLGVAGASKLRFDLQGGPPGISTAPYTSFLNGHTNTGVLRAAGFNIRFTTGWEMDPFTVQVFTNFTNPYWFQNTNPPFNTLGLMPACCSSGTYEKIKSLTTFDLNVGYNLPEDWLSGWTKGTKLTLNIINVLDTNPPFEDTADTGFNGNLPGYDVYNASPLGRLISVGLKKSF